MASSLTSITSRLIILFTVSAVMIFSVTSSLLYWGLAHSLEERSRHYLRDEVNILRTLLVKPDGLAQVQREIDLESNTLEYVQHFVRVLDEKGTPLLETPGMDWLIPAAAFPAPKDAGESPYGERAEWTTADGQFFMLKAVRAKRGDCPDLCVLQVALNVTRRQILLDEYRNKLAAVSAGGVVASLLAAALISRRGLRPLREITRHTQRVSASHLDQRLHSSEWPTELHELAGAFDRMLDRLEDSFQRLSHFASNMAHEFRTPLNNLMGEAEVTLSRPRSPEEYRQLIESNMEEYRRLAQVVDSLLFLARAENGTQPLKVVSFDLPAELINLVDYYQPMAEEKGIALSAHETRPAILAADVQLLRRAVANLLTNAIRYTPAQGRIAVACRELPDGGAAVTVSDTGCGIAAEEIPRLFDRFYRVEAVRSSHPHGHGLGLSIVKSIVDLHGGSVDIRSRPGEGTAITLSFPAAPPAAATCSPLRQQATGVLSA